MLSYHDLESMYKKSLRDEDELKNQLKISMKILEDTDNKNKNFLKKTKTILADYR
jgi:hypothetical protein